MTALTDPVPMSPRLGWLARAEAWLDSKGRGAWIAVMVLGFVFFWPVGLALLAYMIWSNRMFCKSRRHARHHWKSHRDSHGMSPLSPTGNSAFDAYKADTLRRLEQEQQDFEAFLERLREAKDKSEFDQFMDDRARAARDDMPGEETSDEARTGDRPA